MKVAALLSGGKDSIYSMYIASSKSWEIKKTIIMKPENKESWMYHHPNKNIPETQSKLMDIPYECVKTKGEKEKELKSLKRALKKIKKEEGIEGFISGAIESEYQKKRLEYIGEELDLKSFCPLWRKDPEKLMESQIEDGTEFIINKISSGGLNKSWLGRKIDKKALEDLKKLNNEIGIHLAGEGGEYETTVLNSPLFKGKIEVKKAEKIMKGENRGIYEIKEISTKKK
ncbi:MAG: diphthine--ammonia ligase [archaeon]